MISDIISITIKNFKLIVRSKAAILTMILSPLILILLLGIAFNHTNVYNINIGVYSEEYSDLSELLIEKLSTNDFNVIKLSSQEKCIDNVKSGETNICVVFPPGLSIDDDQTSNIDFYVDPSKVNIVWMIQNTISSKFSSASSDISSNTTGLIIQQLKSTSEELSEKKSALETIKENNDKVLSSNNLLKESFEVMDVSISTEDIGIDKLKEVNNNSGSANQENKGMLEYLDVKIDAANNQVDALVKTIGFLSISQKEINELKEDVNKIGTSLDNMKKRVSETDSATIYDTDSINYMIGDIEIKLQRLEKSIEDIKGGKDTIEENVVMLNQSNQEINLLLRSIEDMKYNINSIRIDESGQLTNPVSHTIKPIVAEKTYLNYVFAGLISLIIMFISMLLASAIVLMDKKSKSYLINYLTPTSDFSFVVSTFITIMIMMMFQITVIIILSIMFYKAQFLMNLHTITLILVLSTSLFVLIGMAIAYLFKEEQTITLITVSLSTLFLFLSDIILPIESMPRFFRGIVEFNPFLITERALRKTILFGASFGDILGDLIILIIFVLIVFIFIMTTEGIVKRHIIERLLRK